MKDLTQGSEGRGILRFAAPMLLGHMFQQLYTFVDQIIVGRVLGKEALASVGASFPILFTLIALIIGIATGGTIVIRAMRVKRMGKDAPTEASASLPRTRPTMIWSTKV